MRGHQEAGRAGGQAAESPGEDDGAFETDGFWRTRAEQLQHALDSRIVIEQAKGVLAERFGLDVESAFAVLRAAARHHRLRIRDLASDVVASRVTPEPIEAALRHHLEHSSRGSAR